jgi:hypothetical protein
MKNKFGENAQWGKETKKWDDEGGYFTTQVLIDGEWQEKTFTYDEMSSAVAGTRSVKKTEAENISYAN